MKKTDRLHSLDALRGFDMMWIAGLQQVVLGITVLFPGSVAFNWCAKQMEHVEWHGFQFFDIIFPLFLFIAGVSLPYSIWKRKERGDNRGKIYYHMFKRLILLVLLGLVYNNVHIYGEIKLVNLFQGENAGNTIENFGENGIGLRYASVLARIGFGWFFAALIVLNSGKKWHYIWFGAILLIYWAIMAIIPAPGFSAGNYSCQGNLAGYIDTILLPGDVWFDCKRGDPEGLLSTFPAIATALLGVLVGHFLRDEHKKIDMQKKGFIILAAGALFMLIGWIWGFIFPINKKLWTSSFVLYAGGLSMILLSVFYLIIDVWGYKKWAFPFMVVGLNSITIYIGQKIINFWSMTDFIASGLFHAAPESWHTLLQGIVYTSLTWLFLYFLYRKNIFLKV